MTREVAVRGGGCYGIHNRSDVIHRRTEDGEFSWV